MIPLALTGPLQRRPDLPAPATPPSPRRRRLTVAVRLRWIALLLAEDSPDNQRLIALILKKPRRE